MLTNSKFPTDNDLEIPVLPLRSQAKFIDRPVAPWGGYSDPKHWRPSRGPKGVLCFYVHDERFMHLVDQPRKSFSVPAPVFCELNFSLDKETPLWRAIWLTAQKRLFSVYAWHEAEKEILVDLNVPSAWLQLNMTGVPTGWRSYCTRGSDRDLQSLQDQHAAAVAKFEEAGEPCQKGDLVFLVYGGGPKVQAFCKNHHLEHAELDIERFHRHRRRSDG